MGQALNRTANLRMFSDRMTLKIAAIGASVVLAMRIFSEPPSGRLRREHFVEHVIDEATLNRHDPREVVAGRIVLTLPMDRDAAPRRLGSQFELN